MTSLHVGPAVHELGGRRDVARGGGRGPDGSGLDGDVDETAAVWHRRQSRSTASQRATGCRAQVAEIRTTSDTEHGAGGRSH